MNKFNHYAFRCLSQTAINKAIELGVNPESSNFKKFASDSRYADYYYIVTIDASDGCVIFGTLVNDLTDLGNACPDFTLVN